MAKDFPCYEVSVELIANDDQSAMNLHILFTVDTEEQAVKAGVAWAHNRASCLKATIGAVSVCNHAVCAPEKDGFISLKRSFDFFEWKRDFPSTLDQQAQWVISECRRAKKNNKVRT